MARLILLLGLLMMTSFPITEAIAEDAAQPGDATVAAESNLPEEDEPLPDAMQQLAIAPEMDIASLRDPFSSYLAQVAARGQELIKQNQAKLKNRVKEPLEDYDLSTLTLVAIYQMGENKVAMVEDASGVGHMVKPGNYMGKNNGRIEKISEDSLYLVEQVLNPAGEVIDQQVKLTLQDLNDI